MKLPLEILNKIKSYINQPKDFLNFCLMSKSYLFQFSCLKCLYENQSKFYCLLHNLSPSAGKCNVCF